VSARAWCSEDDVKDQLASLIHITPILLLLPPLIVF